MPSQTDPRSKPYPCQEIYSTEHVKGCLNNQVTRQAKLHFLQACKKMQPIMKGTAEIWERGEMGEDGHHIIDGSHTTRK